MSGLPDGAFLTSINGKQCTAIRRRAQPVNDQKPTGNPDGGSQPSSTPRPQDTPAVTSDPNPPKPSDDPGSIRNNPSKEPDPRPPTDTVGPPGGNPPVPPNDKATKSAKPTTSQPPPPAETTSQPPAETASQSSTETTSQPSTETTSQPPAETTSRPPPPPADTTSSQTRPSSLPPSSETTTLNPEAPAESIARALPSAPASSLETPVTAAPFPAPSSNTASNPAALQPSVQTSAGPSALLPTTAEADRALPTTLSHGLINTIGLDDTAGGGSGSTHPDRDNSSGQNGQSDSGLLGSSMKSRGVIIGSTIGAAAAIGFLALLLWLWRKKSLKKRRSTLLTPFTMPPNREKVGVYEFDNAYVGPMPRSEKIAAAVSNNFRSLGRKFGGNNFTPYMDEPPMRGAPAMGAGAILTAKDRYRNWWSRLGEDAKFNWRVRHEQFGASSRDPSMTRNPDNQQDFGALIDIGEQEAQRRRSRGSRGSSYGSVNSRDHSLDALNVDLHTSASIDPFSDLNAVSRQPRRSLHGGPNSLSFDASGVQIPGSTVHPPNSYVAEVQRSRNRTMSGGGGSRPQSGGSTTRSVYRSHQSFDSLAARRNKFRSDPFDLEIENRSLLSDSDLAQMPNVNSDDRPSLTPKYTSGVSSVSSSGSIRSVSTGEWSDPGPDVGPAVARRADSTASRGEKRSARNRRSNDIGIAM